MLIKNGHIVDPVNKREGDFDILIKGSKIEKVEKGINAGNAEVIDASGMIVTPGLIDMHVHLREPGREDIETVASGTRAAVAGGMTSICSMLNTMPPIDSPKRVKELKGIIAKDAVSNVFVAGAITIGREGRKVADIAGMKKSGVIAITDDGSAVQDSVIMLRALKAAKEEKVLVISHCEDKSLSGSGVMNEGIIATKLGLRGIPRKAEFGFVARDIELARKAKARIHIAHVSCKESVDIIRKAKKAGVPVTCETAPHYFSLRDSCCETYDTRTKMNPPLRSEEDVAAIIEGLRDGTIDAIASDHAPHSKHEKEIVFDEAAFGIIGLETALGLAVSNLINAKKLSWMRLIELMAGNPARILGLRQKGSLAAGCDADITIIDPRKEWVFTKDSVVSKSKNSPFLDWRLAGKARDVIVGCRVVLRDERLIDG